ncbi:hypothetical protein CapIbe_021565 [Capra ibex]
MTESLRTFKQTTGTRAKSPKGTGSPKRDTDWELHMYVWSAELSQPELFRPAALSRQKHQLCTCPKLAPWR